MEQSINDLRKTYLKDKEVFLIVKDFPRYAVSNHGRVKDTLTNKIMSTDINRFGNKCVCVLSKPGSYVLKSIDHLVADAFLETPRNMASLLHIDGNKLNDNLSNLAYETSSNTKPDSSDVYPSLESYLLCNIIESENR